MHVRGESRAWVLRYTRQGKAKEVVLGAPPGISFKRTFLKAGEASILLAEGQYPVQAWAAERMETSRVVSTVLTFTQVPTAYIRQHRGGWKNRKLKLAGITPLLGDGHRIGREGFRGPAV